jgi:hypothetical protein
MQRVRIGLTGLAFVFLAVLLAAILIGRANDGAPVCNSTDPLGAAGLTPCNPDSNTTGATPAAAATPAGPRR